MPGIRVSAPDGREWSIRRRWAPRAPRWVRREKRGDDERRTRWYDWIDFPWDIGGMFDEGPAAAILVLLVIVALIVLFPVVFFVLDFLLLMLLVVAGVVARVLFRRPWTVEASSTEPSLLERRWQVVGWRRSGALLEDIQVRLMAGQQLEQLPTNAP